MLLNVDINLYITTLSPNNLIFKDEIVVIICLISEDTYERFSLPCISSI